MLHVAKFGYLSTNDMFFIKRVAPICQKPQNRLRSSNSSKSLAKRCPPNYKTTFIINMSKGADEVAALSHYHGRNTTLSANFPLKYSWERLLVIFCPNSHGMHFSTNRFACLIMIGGESAHVGGWVPTFGQQKNYCPEFTDCARVTSLGANPPSFWFIKQYLK